MFSFYIFLPCFGKTFYFLSEYSVTHQPSCRQHENITLSLHLITILSFLQRWNILQWYFTNYCPQNACLASLTTNSFFTQNPKQPSKLVHNVNLSYTHTERQALASVARSHWNALWRSRISPRPIPKRQGEWHPVHNGSWCLTLGVLIPLMFRILLMF